MFLPAAERVHIAILFLRRHWDFARCVATTARPAAVGAADIAPGWRQSLARLFPKLASALGVLDSAKIGCQGGRARAFEENPRRQPGAMSAAPSAAGLAVVAPLEISPADSSPEGRFW